MSMTNVYITPFTKSSALVGRYFKLVSASGTVHLEFEYEDDSTVKTELVQGLGLRFDKPYKRVLIHSESEQMISIWSGFAELTDDRSETTLAGSTGLENSSATLTPNVATKVANQRLGRRSVLLQSDEPFYVGGKNVTIENGIEVDGSVEIECQSEIYAIAATAATVRVLSEVN